MSIFSKTVASRVEHPIPKSLSRVVTWLKFLYNVTWEPHARCLSQMVSRSVHML